MKKLIALFLLLALFVSTNIFGIVSFAANDIRINSGYATVKTKVLLNGTTGSRNITLNNHEELDPAGRVPLVPYYSLVGYVCYPQIDETTCGPAVVKAVLQYINGTSASVSAIADACGNNSIVAGTTDRQICDYLNLTQSEHTYTWYNPVDKTTVKRSDFLYYVERNIAIHELPLLLVLYSMNPSRGWPYTLKNLHWVSVYSYYDATSITQKTIGIADPWIGYNPSLADCSPMYEMSAEAVWSSLSSYSY